MFTLHETSISKPQRIIGYLLSLVPSLIVFLSGVVKFTPNAPILDMLERLGVAEHAVLIGVVEILCVILYWIPRTSNFGFFLFCTYSGGIIVGEMIVGDLPIPGIAIAVMIYTGTLLRKPSLSGWSV